MNTPPPGSFQLIRLACLFIQLVDSDIGPFRSAAGGGFERVYFTMR